MNPIMSIMHICFPSTDLSPDFCKIYVPHCMPNLRSKMKRPNFPAQPLREKNFYYSILCAIEPNNKGSRLRVYGSWPIPL